MPRPGAYTDATLQFGPNAAELNRRAASYVDKMLKGAKPADRPMQQPAAFALAINLKTAKALGLTVPPSLLARADQLIEYVEGNRDPFRERLLTHFYADFPRQGPGGSSFDGGN